VARIFAVDRERSTLMTGEALALLIFALVVVWGGLIASAFYLRARPELTTYPPGGEDEPGEVPE